MKPVKRVRERTDKAAKEKRDQRNKTLDEAAVSATMTTRKQRAERYEDKRRVANEKAEADIAKVEADVAEKRAKMDADAKQITEADATATAEKRAKIQADKSIQVKNNQKIAINALNFSDSCKCGPAINR